ncbi:hypothetical protein [Flexivirga sp. B27]
MTDAFGIPRGSDGSESQSRAMYEAATNLLDKAVRALSGGQADRALGCVRKAERLPYDDHDAASPLTLAAHMHAVNAVLDVHELGNELWLDAAADVLHDPRPTWNALATADFRHVLTVVREDLGATKAEERQLRDLIRGQQVATIREMQELQGEQLCEVVMSLLEIVIDYELRADELFAAIEPN